MSAVDAIEFTEGGSFTAQLESQRYEESGGVFGADMSGLENSDGYNPTFKTAAPEADLIGVIAERLMGNSANSSFIDPKTDNTNVMTAPALAAGAIAATAKEQKIGAVNGGQKFDVSEKANSTKFFSGQNKAQDKNDVKLDKTKQNIEVLAGADQKLAGAEQQMKVNQSGMGMGGAQSTQQALNESDPAMKSAAGGGLIKNMVLGSAAASVASFLAPGAAPAVKAIAALGTINAAGQSAALTFGGSGSTNYDKPRSKAEAREMRDPAASTQSPSTNYFDNTTSGAMIQPPSKLNNDFGLFAANDPIVPEMNPAQAQILELQKARGEIHKQGKMQTAQFEDAEVAAEMHEQYRENPKLGFGELLRAADAGQVRNGGHFKAMASQVESTDRLVDAMNRGKISPDLTPELSFVGSSGPKLS